MNFWIENYFDAHIQRLTLIVLSEYCSSQCAESCSVCYFIIFDLLIDLGHCSALLPLSFSYVELKELCQPLIEL